MEVTVFNVLSIGVLLVAEGLRYCPVVVIVYIGCVWILTVFMSCPLLLVAECPR